MTEEILRQCTQYMQETRVVKGRVFGRFPAFRPCKMMEIDPSVAQAYLDDNREGLFRELLFAYIDASGHKDSEIYKKAFIDRRLFSKIRSIENYTPAKKTVIALCLALELPRADTDKLLSSAGYSLSRAEDYDLIVAFCIEKKIFDLYDINDILYHFGLETF